EIGLDVGMPRKRITRPLGFLSATGQARERFANVVQLNVVRQDVVKVRIDCLDPVVRIDIVVDAEPNVPAGASVRGVEAEAFSVTRVANRLVIAGWRKSKQLSDPRVNRAAGERQKVHRIQCSVVSSNVSEVTGTRSGVEHGAVRGEVLGGVGLLEKEVEEQLAFLRELGTPFTRSRQSERRPDVESPLVLQQFGFRQFRGVVKESIGVKLTVAIIVISFAVKVLGTAGGGELDLRDSQPLIRSGVLGSEREFRDASRTRRIDGKKRVGAHQVIVYLNTIPRNIRKRS